MNGRLRYTVRTSTMSARVRRTVVPQHAQRQQARHHRLPSHQTARTHQDNQRSKQLTIHPTKPTKHEPTPCNQPTTSHPSQTANHTHQPIQTQAPTHLHSHQSHTHHAHTHTHRTSLGRSRRQEARQHPTPAPNPAGTAARAPRRRAAAARPGMFQANSAVNAGVKKVSFS